MVSADSGHTREGGLGFPNLLTEKLYPVYQGMARLLPLFFKVFLFDVNEYQAVFRSQ